MENLNFLFAAYSITWVVLFLYVFSIWRKQNRLDKGLQRLHEKIRGEERKPQTSELRHQPGPDRSSLSHPQPDSSSAHHHTSDSSFLAMRRSPLSFGADQRLRLFSLADN